MSNKKSSNFSSIFPFIAIPVTVVVGVVIYLKLLGSPANFQGYDPNKTDYTTEQLDEIRAKEHPVKTGIRSWYGTIYKGGIIVPCLIATLLTVLIFFVERMVSMMQARGSGNVTNFVRNIRGLLQNNQVDQAIALCDKQRGSIGNVMKSGLQKYKALETEQHMDKDQKLESLKQEIEEATALELPMLSKNLVILSTCASLGVLIGLIGTVMGMIKAFQSMSSSVPDPATLSLGISEALVNTFLGILASALAIIFFNFFSNRVDQMTYSIDEAGFSVAQTFAQKH
ncbi:MAG: MotA/TolQ/ExbB proton channel family protein [Flavobacteriales bacterium]